MTTYANTHSSGSACGIQTTYFYHEARALIKEELHGTDDDVVLFAGTGCTGAIAKMVHLLGISPERSRRPGPDSDTHHCRFPGCGRTFANPGALVLHARTHQDGDRTSLLKKPLELSDAPGADETASPSNTKATVVPSSVVVFVGPMEHHSNLLVWREADCTVVELGADSSGRVNLTDLEAKLKLHATAALKVGSFSAGSNLTGVMERVDEITVLLHRHGALAMWDYAAAGPHVDIDLNPTGIGIEDALLAKDAVFLSPHKFPGGPGTPGVLVLKKGLLRNPVPHVPGGGTVFYVSEGGHRYLENIEEREEGACVPVVVVRLLRHLHLTRQSPPPPPSLALALHSQAYRLG